MNHQWRYFYQPYPYVHYQSPYETTSYQDQYAVTPKPYPENTYTPKKVINYDTPAKNAALLKKMEKIYEKLNQLEEENKELKEEMDNIKPLTIENINYKIQELHVQDLSGNLMVGLTALSDAEELQKLLEENDSMTFNDMDTGEFEKAMKENEAMDDQNEEG
ncbi:hypothetical protein ACDX78_02845 [Virgibacillus oceani]